MSAGPDSMALLWLIDKLKIKYAFKINVAHLNHGLLKKAGNEYLKLVKKTSQALKIPFYSKTIDLKTLAKKNKRSIEEMGRIERYSFFEDIAAKTRADKIVTAHTLDDQAETMLLRLIRGSGLKGLIGIPYKRNQGRFQVIRPLLSTEKKDLVIFLKENRLPFLLDRTNRDRVFARNRVRHRLLPTLAKFYNPKIKHLLANLESICAEIQDYLDTVSRAAFRACGGAHEHGNKVTLRLEALERLHPAIRREVLLKALENLKGSLKRFAYEHVSSVVEMIRSEEDGLECHLPGLVTVKKRGKNLEFVLKRR